MDGSNQKIVIVGGGAAGIAVAASLLARRRNLDITVIEPSALHRYQPGLTLVGGGVFDAKQLVRPMQRVMPKQVRWLQNAASALDPERNRVRIEDGSDVGYDVLIVAPGLELDWRAVEGLSETLGENGVTSNYSPEHASYTWQLVKGLGSGRAVFTQPPMPIKCAGAPQKAVYLSCYEWERRGCLNQIDVSFMLAADVLFGVPDYVPALEGYMHRYGVDLGFGHNLTAVDGPARTAYFTHGDETVELAFDMLHVTPPQRAPEFVAASPLAASTGWLEVEPDTLRNPHFENVYALGDVCSAPNAKTAAAVRKQAPVVAENVLATLDGQPPVAAYEGYGSCPLTVERGRVVLAEFGYGGRLEPSFPEWLLDGKQATRLGWVLKKWLLPPIYFDLMLKGREWLARPKVRPAAPAGVVTP